MNKSTIKNIYYIIAFGYVLVGISLLDWSFNMISPTSNMLVPEMVRLIVMDSFYIVLGIVLYFATFFSIRNKAIGETLFRIIFMGGVFLIFGAAVVVLLLNKVTGYPADYLKDFSTNVVLFVPAILLFINRKKIRGVL